jgi:hypothetical protein
MSTINIYDLNPAGSDLFSDSESYMNEMSEGELTHVLGGRRSQRCGRISIIGNLIFELSMATKNAQWNKQPFDWTQATA